MTTSAISTPGDGPRRRWYGIPQAAELLGLSKQTLYRRVRMGVVVLPRLDGRLVVPASRLEELRHSPGVAARQYQRRGRRSPES